MMDRKEAIKMTREEAILYLETMKMVPSENWNELWKETAEKRNQVIDIAIEALLEDRPIAKWKPMSEGPPQRVGSYLVTCKGEHGFVYTDYDFWTVSDEFKYNHDNVIAWVPFLKPYKESK